MSIILDTTDPRSLIIAGRIAREPKYIIPEQDCMVWIFIEKYLPNYYTRGEVLENDVLCRLANDEEVVDSDREYFAYLDTKEKIDAELLESTISLFNEALENADEEVKKRLTV